MPATIAVREIHPDLPIDRVWQAGRRLYARCGRHSRLSDALHAMGAKWDTKEQALWVGSGKRARFTPLALRHHAAVTRYNEIRTAGHWVAIPYGAVLIRARVRELGGVWDPDTKRWALPTPADQIEIMELVQIWRRARDAEAEKRRQAMRERRQAERILSDLAVRAELLRKAAREEQRWEAGVRERELRRAAHEAAAFRAALAERAGRSLTGHVETLREVYPRYITRDAAREAASMVGQTLRLPGGRRALVTGRRIGYVPAESAYLYGQDRAHVYVEYDLAVVAPTEKELDGEAGRAAERMDAHELHALVTDVAVLSFPAAVDQWTPMPDHDGVIAVTTGVNGLIPAGRLVLGWEGALWWQHPGVHDDYVPVEGRIRDGGLAGTMRRLLAVGPRRRVVPGCPPLYYEVRDA